MPSPPGQVPSLQWGSWAFGKSSQWPKSTQWESKARLHQRRAVIHPTTLSAGTEALPPSHPKCICWNLLAGGLLGGHIGGPLRNEIIRDLRAPSLLLPENAARKAVYELGSGLTSTLPVPWGTSQPPELGEINAFVQAPWSNSILLQTKTPCSSGAGQGGWAMAQVTTAMSFLPLEDWWRESTHPILWSQRLQIRAPLLLCTHQGTLGWPFVTTTIYLEITVWFTLSLMLDHKSHEGRNRVCHIY